MAVEPDAEEIRRLLSTTSVVPSSGPDVDAITGGVRRRRRTRRGAAGLAAVLLLGVGAAVVLPGDDDPTQVEVVDEPDTTAPEPPDPGPDDLGAIELHLADLEAVTPEEIGRDVLVFGDDGIARIVDGQPQQVWDEPVEHAFDDLVGGVVFQDRSVVTELPDGRVDVERGAVRHLAGGETTPGEIVPASDGPTLWAVSMTGGLEPGEPLHGRPGHVWFTRTDPGSSDESAEPSATLFTAWLESGDEREIGQAGSALTGLDGIARLGDGRTLFSTCHLQCSVRDRLDSPDPIVLPHWLGGLDGTPTGWGYVRFEMPGADGQPTAPVLTIHGLDDVIRVQLRLPEEIGFMTHVDLSDDGTAALVWSVPWNETEVVGPVYVDRLDTEAPRVRRVDAGGQQIRFVD